LPISRINTFNNFYMDRKDFFKSACGLGICSCVGVGLLSGGKVLATESIENDWKEKFVKYRYAKLIGILDSNLDEETKNKIIERLGNECSNDGFANNYKNNLDGFFNEIHNRWGENATFDKEKGLIRVETPERDCVCPLIDSKLISKSVCQCSVGWQAQTYRTILGKEVNAKCVESVIRGSKRCVFEITILNS
jgi:predicted hydrocarbon binding protein